jgi:LPXTG-motif cell wall-anchored protein
MSDKELLLVLGAAAVLIIAAFFSTRRRKRLNSTDYWLPDGSRVRRLKTD